MACSATAYMLVDKENPDCVAQVLGVHFPEISLYGECSNVRWSGNTAIVYDEETYDSKIIRIFANGEMHFDVSSDLSFEGADAFNEVGEKTFSTKADDYLLQEQFVWRLKTI